MWIWYWDFHKWQLTLHQTKERGILESLILSNEILHLAEMVLKLRLGPITNIH